MKSIGAFFRYLLNINTVWGLMILSAIVLTAVQHYTPIRTSFDSSAWLRGDNQMEIEVVQKDKVYKTAFDLTFDPEGAGLVIPSEYKEDQEQLPFLVSVGSIGDRTFLRWKAKPWGTYSMTINGEKVSTGEIVNLKRFSDGALDYAKVAFNLALGLVAVFVLFLGLMKVGEDAGIVNVVAKVVRPVIRFLFPDVPENHPANGAILMNVTTSMLGLGNAATPFGLKAMEELQSLNPYKNIASDSQIMLMAWNTAGWAFLPITMIAVRQSAGTTNALEIVLPCTVAGVTATLTGIVAVKLLGKLPFFTVEAALAEEAENPESNDEKKEG